MRRNILPIAALVFALACDNSGSKITAPEYYNGAVYARFYLDMDGDGVRSQTDSGVPGIRLVLFSANGSDTLRNAISDSTGLVSFKDLPLGSYRFSIVGSTIGDSIRLIQGDSSRVRILARLDSLTDMREFLLSWPTLTTAEARTAAHGKRVLIKGRMLAPAQLFQSRIAFVGDSQAAIRVADVSYPVGQGEPGIGDSVVVIGRVESDQGQPILRSSLVRTLGSRPTPLPRVTTVSEARTANGGELDARYVEVSGLTVGDTLLTANDYRMLAVSALDPEENVVVLIDRLIDVVHARFKLGQPVVVRGVLVPQADGSWAIRPRTTLDIIFP